MVDTLEGFTESTFTHDAVTRPVYRGGSGPGVVVVHEIPGITPLVAAFGRRLIDAGFTVAMPSLVGEPGKAMTFGYTLKSFGQSRERNILKRSLNYDEQSLVTQLVCHWLKQGLAKTR